MASAVRVSIEEYLRTSYHPDVEYLDGELKEKAVVGFAHGRVQVLLSAWFWQHEQDWQIQCAVEARTRVSSEHVRIPDFVIVVRANREKGTLVDPPLVAIEVLSPSDSYRDLKLRAADLELMGVRNIWLLDPEARTAEIWRTGAWHLAQNASLQAVGSPIYLDLQWLWQQLDQ